MNRLSRLLLLGAGLACASSTGSNAASLPKAADPAARPAHQQIADALAKGHAPAEIRVCEYEEVLGTRIRQVSCRSLDEQEQERAAAMRTMMQIQQVQTAKSGG